MSRVARIVLPGQPHHVTQRGNNHQDVFFVDDDRRVYLDLLRVHCERFADQRGTAPFGPVHGAFPA